MSSLNSKFEALTIHNDNEQAAQKREKKRDRRPLWFAFWVSVIYAMFAGMQLQIMRDTLNMDQRPWVGVVSNGGIGLKLLKGQPIEISANAQNTGKTPALNVVSVNHMQFVGFQGHYPNFNDYAKADADTPLVLFPGSITTLHVNTRKPMGKASAILQLTEPDIEKLQTGVLTIYFYGSIWYDDTLRIHWYDKLFNVREHKTDYCFYYVPEISAALVASFAACKEHNYAD